MVINLGFAAMYGSINIFSVTRPIFIQERLSNVYSTSSYYVGRSLAYLPIELILPVVLVIVQYFFIHLDNSASAFFATLGSFWLVYWMSSAYGLLLSSIFPDPEVALTVVAVLILPLMLLGGFFAPLENVSDVFRVFEVVSVFKYGYQTTMQGNKNIN